MEPNAPILLVEDDVSVAHSLMRFLEVEDLGPLIWVETQDDAEVQLRDNEFSAVVLDGNVPRQARGSLESTDRLVSLVVERVKGPIIRFSAQNRGEEFDLSQGFTHSVSKGKSLTLIAILKGVSRQP